MGDNFPPEIESDSWCRTSSGDKASITFSWTIEDFLNRPEKLGESLLSSPFTVAGPGDKVTTWELKTYPKGEREYDSEASEDEETTDNKYVPLYLRNTEKTPEKAKFKMSILNGRRQKKKSVDFSTKEYIEISEGGKCSVGYGIVSIKELKDHPDLLPGGNLTFVCGLTVHGPAVTRSGSKFPDEKLSIVDNCGKEMNDQIGKLFGERKFSDVKITCGEEVFDCHRNILSVRSPVFDAMFQSDMVENRSKNVLIKDIKPKVVKEMLYFIYNGATSTENVMDEIGRDLLGAADQYQLELLKNNCEEKLCSLLDASNSVELLVLADLHKAFRLRRMALKLVTKNMDAIVNTEVYKDFIAHHPGLNLEITQALVQKVGAKRKRENAD